MLSRALLSNDALDAISRVVHTQARGIIATLKLEDQPKYYDALRAEIRGALEGAMADGVASVDLTIEEIHALLWAGRNLSLETLHDGPYAPRDGVTGHGALSTAINKVEQAGTDLLDATDA